MPASRWWSSRSPGCQARASRCCCAPRTSSRPGSARWPRAGLPHNRVLAETVVEVDYEITLLTVRTTGPTGPALHFCEPIGHRQGDGDVLEAWQPQPMIGRRAGRGEVDRRAHRQRARRARRVRRRAAGARRRGVLRRRPHSRPHDSGLVTASVATAFGVRTARARDPRAAGGHHHDLAGGRRGDLRRRRVGDRRRSRRRTSTPCWPTHWPSPRATCGCSTGPTRPTPSAARVWRWPPAPDVTTARDRVRRVTGVLRKLW